MDWSQLMAAAQDGDRSAYAALLCEAIPFLRALARERLPDREAEETVRRSLLAIHRLRHTYDPRRPIEPWLRAIARVEIRGILKARRVTAPHRFMRMFSGGRTPKGFAGDLQTAKSTVIPGCSA